MAISRRNVIHSLLAGITVAECYELQMPANAATPTPVFTDLIERQLPSIEELWRGQQLLADNCPARPGSEGHNRFVDYLTGQLSEAGIPPQRRSLHVPYWETSGYGIKLNGRSLPTAGVRPRSGPTPQQGVTAPLHYAGVSPNLDYSGAAGKIVLIDVPSNGAMLYRFGEPYGVYPAEEHFPLDEVKAQWTIRNTPPAEDALQAGAVGVVYVMNGFSDAVARNQELPHGALISIPVLWVDQAVGRRLRAEAARGALLNMVLDATITPNTPTDNLWGVLPGRSDEVIVVHTHTDGCNSLEDNGGIFVVALAKALAKVPIAQRNRSYAFVMTTGHFAREYANGSEDWIEHNQDIFKRTVGALVIEHIGAKEWFDDSVTGKYGPTDRLAWGRPNITNDSLKALMLQAVVASDVRRVAILGVEAKTRATTGEGTPWSTRGIPTIGYIGGEHWLFANPGKGGFIERMDKAQMHRGLQAFARVLEKMDTMSVAELKA